MSSVHRRMRRHAQRERRRRGARIVGMGVTNWAYAAIRLARCDCPAVVIPHADLPVVEHHHRHGCPALAEWGRR